MQTDSFRLDAIVLAAGAGRRFGGRKLLAPFEGRPLVCAALDAAFGAPARTVVVAVSGDAALDAAVLDHARRLGRIEDVRLLVVEDAAEGMGASLSAAVCGLPPDSSGAFVFLGDMPRVPAQTALALAERFGGEEALIAPRHQGRRGHPVLFGAAWYPALRALRGDVGAQAVLKAAGERLDLVDGFDAGVLFDVDLVTDLGAPSRHEGT